MILGPAGELHTGDAPQEAARGINRRADELEQTIENWGMGLLKFMLNYGPESLPCELSEQQVVWKHAGPPAVADLAQTIDATLATPRDYPCLTQAVIPEDHVAIVVDPDTPAWTELVNATGRQLCQAGVAREAIQVILNQPLPPEAVASAAAKIEFPLCDHETILSGKRTYLASTAEGDRIYLPAALVDADCVVTISRFGFDEQWGYRGTHSTIYPALASEADRQRLQGKSHQELKPENSRGQRQTIDEIGWLLGLQYTVQVIPATSGEVGHLLCGACDSVFQRGVELLNESWRATVSQRAETVVIALAGGAAQTPWSALSRACKSAAKLVLPEGRVILLANPPALPETLLEILKNPAEPDELLRKLNRIRMPETDALHALVQLTKNAKVYFRSPWEDDTVENLYCIPLNNEPEIRRALEGGETYAILEGAQYAYLDVE